MDAGAKKILETVTHETLHAQNFSRSSTQASLVLTDLLSRYLALLSSSCAKYAEHAGRLRLTTWDAVSALNDLGVSVEELSEYCSSEGKEMSRYAVHSARRVEDLNEFKASLAIGVREDRDDVASLVYAPAQSLPSYEGGESSESEEEEEEEELDQAHLQHAEEEEIVSTPMDVDMLAWEEREASPGLKDRAPPRPTSPPLPLSPISNPSTPPRKRPRTAGWHHPPHIPDFLPPFPTDSPRHTPSPPPAALSEPPAAQPVKVERPASPPPELSASTSPADYLTPVPYSLSVLASQPTWHLPTKPSSPPPAPPKLPVPQVQPALFSAYHHILTHPPPAQVPPPNPARYRVALALLAQAEANPRWDTPATLFASCAPNAPRVAPIGPSYAVPITRPGEKEGKEGKDKGKEVEAEIRLPPVPPRPVATTERIAPLVSQQTSRIPSLARQVLPGTVFSRTTRLAHPPVLQRGTQKLTYGSGVNAPWNTGPAPPPPPGGKDAASGAPNGKDASAAKPLPDARLYATWDWEQKRYQEPLPGARRTRLGGVQASGSMSNGMSTRTRSENRAS